jgi:hypothetical protein
MTVKEEISAIDRCNPNTEGYKNLYHKENINTNNMGCPLLISGTKSPGKIPTPFLAK